MILPVQHQSQQSQQLYIFIKYTSYEDKVTEAVRWALWLV